MQDSNKVIILLTQNINNMLLIVVPCGIRIALIIALSLAVARHVVRVDTWLCEGYVHGEINNVLG